MTDPSITMDDLANDIRELNMSLNEMFITYERNYHGSK